MERISKGNGYSICFATDEHYVSYLRVTLFSLLCNRNQEREYDIVVLHTGLTEEHIRSFFALTEPCEGVQLRFFDVSETTSDIQYETGSYLSMATIYRLLLLSDMFAEYGKVLYLDCDLIVNEDVGLLFETDMTGHPVAAVEELGFRQLSYSKKALFLNGSEPYNADNYRKDALKMHHPEQYFNAGVVLFDLTHCRPDHTFQKAYQILTEKKYSYNDQDVLNMLFDGKVTMLPAKWNYQNCVEAFCDRYPDIYGPMYQDVRGEKPAIIHYVSSYKPWKCTVAMDSYYHTYVDKLEHFVEG